MAGSNDPLATLWTDARIKWHVTLEDSAGVFVRAEVWLAPGAGERAWHDHPEREERIEVLSGTAEVVFHDGSEIRAGGGRLTIVPGRVHRLRNAGGDVLHLMVELRRPATDLPRAAGAPLAAFRGPDLGFRGDQGVPPIPAAYRPLDAPAIDVSTPITPRTLP